MRNDSGEKPPTKVRTAIVINIDSDSAGGPFFTIVWGTKTPQAVAVCVRRGEAAHEQARLSAEATYFGASGKEFCELEDMWPKEDAENALTLALQINKQLMARKTR